MDISVLLVLVKEIFCGIFNFFFTPIKLTVLSYRKLLSHITHDNGDVEEYWNLIVFIENNTIKPITVIEIKYGKNKWEYIYEGPFTIYPNIAENMDSKNIDTNLILEHVLGEQGFSSIFCEDGSVLVKDINNKIYKSKFISTKFWV